MDASFRWHDADMDAATSRSMTSSIPSPAGGGLGWGFGIGSCPSTALRANGLRAWSKAGQTRAAAQLQTMLDGLGLPDT